jgi:sugar phosphate isomerase/epimerase
MSPIVDDMEIILFESSDFSNLPTASEINEMKRLAILNDLTYSIHFPIDRKAGAENTVERQLFYEQVAEILSLTRKLPVSGYVLHCEGITFNSDMYKIANWEIYINNLLSKLSEKHPEQLSQLCIENLGYNPLLNKSFIDTYKLNSCLDIGHLWLYECDWATISETLFNTVKIIHFHGVSNGKDHTSIKKHDNKPELELFVKKILKKYTNTVTLEVFNEEDTFESLEYLGKLWEISH